MSIQDLIRDNTPVVFDFQKPGISFYNIMPLMNDPKIWDKVIDAMVERIRPFQPDKLIGLESRGFLIVPRVAHALGIGFIVARKQGKLPPPVISSGEYGLEYGKAVLEVEAGVIEPGSRIHLIDDVLATGGTIEATIKIVHQAKANVCGTACLIELDGLKGRERLQRLDCPVQSLALLPADAPRTAPDQRPGCEAC